MPALDLGASKQFRLLVERAFQFAGAAAEQCGLGALCGKLLFAFRDAAVKRLDAATLGLQFPGGGGKLDAFGLAAIFRSLDVLLGSRKTFLERLDLRLERVDLALPRGGNARLLLERAHKLGKLRLLVGERALGLVHRGGLDRNLLLGRAQLIAQRLVARLEGEDRGGLLAEFDLKSVDGVVLLAELGKLARRLGLKLLDAHFQPPRGHGDRKSTRL